MKILYKFLFAVSVVIVLLFSVLCSYDNSNDSHVLTTESSLGEYNFNTEWPDNEFTENVPKPEHGSVWYTYSFNDRDAFSVSLDEISVEESDIYIEKLKSYGYVILRKASNDVSTGINMVKDNIYLSIAYSEGVLDILIMKDAPSNAYMIQ